PRSLDPRAERAVADLDRDRVPWRDRGGLANQPAVLAHDRVAALERRVRRQRAEAPGRVLEPCPLSLDGEERRAPKSAVCGLEPLAPALDRAPDPAVKPVACALEPRDQLAEIRDDELAGDARGRRAHVGGEVAERRVLLV